jgi:hypothetical protein
MLSIMSFHEFKSKNFETTPLNLVPFFHVKINSFLIVLSRQLPLACTIINHSVWNS